MYEKSYLESIYKHFYDDHIKKYVPKYFKPKFRLNVAQPENLKGKFKALKELAQAHDNPPFIHYTFDFLSNYYMPLIYDTITSNIKEYYTLLPESLIKLADTGRYPFRAFAVNFNLKSKRLSWLFTGLHENYYRYHRYKYIPIKLAIKLWILHTITAPSYPVSEPQESFHYLNPIRYFLLLRTRHLMSVYRMSKNLDTNGKVILNLADKGNIPLLYYRRRVYILTYYQAPLLQALLIYNLGL